MEEIVDMARMKARIQQHNFQKSKRENRYAQRSRGRKNPHTAASSSSGVPAMMMMSMDAYDNDLDDFRMQHCGFSQGDVEELMCQGVKPWDDDAWVSYRSDLCSDKVLFIVSIGCFARTLLILT